MATIKRGSTATGTMVWGNAQPIALTSLNSAQPPVPVIGRPLWCGWFEFIPATLPGNCELVQVSTWQWKLISSGRKVAVYVSGEPDGSLTSLNANIVKVKDQGVPVIAYWPRSLQLGALPTGADWIGVEAYRLKGDTLSAWELKVRAAVVRCPKAVLIAQCYTSNATLTTDLRSLVPVYAQIAKDTLKVIAVIPFSGSGRATGFQDHPDVQPLWKALAAGIPGPPEIESPPPPPPPPETDVTPEQLRAYLTPQIDVIAGVKRDYPSLKGHEITDQVIHRLNKKHQTDRYGRKARQSGGRNPNDDTVTIRLKDSDLSQKKMIDVLGNAHPGDPTAPEDVPTWGVIPVSQEAGNGFWTPAVHQDRDGVLPPPPPPPPPPPVNVDYTTFVVVESALILGRYRSVHGREPAASDLFHNAWRRLREGWTLDAILKDIGDA